ncbi:MAG: GNAT family N-acetyltransferase [Planctomycetota bacterium]|nr:GNAT family N-acetyltransferase [Planctomycetota bacterium]
MSAGDKEARRVLLLIDEYQGEDGGTEGQVATLIRHMPAPWTAELWALRNAPYFETGGLPCPTRVVKLRSVKNPLFLASLRGLADDIRKAEFDLVHAFMADGAIWGPLIAERAGVPVITSRRDLGYWQTPRKLDVLRMTNRGADLVLANAQAVAERTVEVEWVPPAKVAVVANGHDPARFDVPAREGLRAELGVERTARLVGLVANFRPLKRQADLVEALAKLGEEVGDVHALFLGEYDDAEVRERAATLGVGERVHVLRPGKAVVPILKELDVGVLCSESEGLSNAILEYMACGLPVVASAVGGTPDLVVPGETGYLYPAGDVDALTEALGTVLGDAAHAAALGQAGRARFDDTYTATRMAADTTAHYARVVAARRRTTPDVSVEVVDTLDALYPIGMAWDALLTDEQFFLTPTWAFTWFQVSEETPCVVIVRDADGELLGLLPLARDGRTVRFPGRELGADHLDVVAREGHADTVARAALAALREAGVRHAELHHVTEDGALRRALHDPALGLAFTEYQSTVAHYAAREADFDAYLQARYSRGARNRFRRNLKRFEKREGAAVEVITSGDAAAGLLDRVFGIHGASLEEASTFATDTQRAFHERLIPYLAQEGRLFATVLRAEGKDLAVEYGFRFQGRLYGYQSGMAPDDETPSPGTLLLYLTLRDQLFGTDAQVYDFLDGDEAYKSRWRSGTRRLYDVEVDLRRDRGGMRGFGAALKTLVKEELKRRVRRGASEAE